MVECPQDKMIATIGPLKTIQLNWLQPHEGSIVDFLYRARAFQFDKGMVKI